MNRFGGANNVHVVTANIPIYNEQMVTYEQRLETFANWKTESAPTPKQLARCGFYYTGINDRTVCFYCGKSVYEWRLYDNPWIEHSIYSKDCPYIRLNRSTISTYNWNSELDTVQDPTLFETCVVTLPTSKMYSCLERVKQFIIGLFR